MAGYIKRLATLVNFTIFKICLTLILYLSMQYLAGGELAGLADVMDTCMSQLQELQVLINIKSAMQVRQALQSVKTIVVRYVK